MIPLPAQIRAENLSGDCRFNREFTRRNWHFTKQQQACVRRRAILSVAANPNCKSREEAERVVNEVFESCWPDTRPFDEVRPSSTLDLSRAWWLKTDARFPRALCALQIY